MAEISIENLESRDSKSFLISLKETELDLLQNAVARAIDARQVAGGISTTLEPFPTIGRIPPTMGYTGR